MLWLRKSETPAPSTRSAVKPEYLDMRAIDAHYAGIIGPSLSQELRLQVAKKN